MRRCDIKLLESGIAFLKKPLFKWRLSNSNISKIGSAELRIKANILYNEWANNFVTSVEALNKKDKLKIERTKKTTSCLESEKYIRYLK